MHYLKFQLPFGMIREKLQAGGFKNVIFHIDLPSISRGFYNKQVVQYEITNYLQTRQPPTMFFDEAHQFLARIWEQFGQYNPMFNIFYDDGGCVQNNTIYKGYKDRTSGAAKLLLEDAEMQLYYEIKGYYYNEFVDRFTIPWRSKVLFLKDYEADFIPWVMYRLNLWTVGNPDTLNVILSTDKDLLQCCQLPNFIQAMTLYSPRENKLLFNLYDNDTALSQLYDKHQRGLLGAAYVSTVLSIAGDKADKIKGVPRIGPATAYKLIVDNQMGSEITKSSPLPTKLEPHRDQLVLNYKVVNFDEQLKRIPLNIQEKIKQEYSF